MPVYRVYLTVDVDGDDINWVHSMVDEMNQMDGVKVVDVDHDPDNDVDPDPNNDNDHDPDNDHDSDNDVDTDKVEKIRFLYSEEQLRKGVMCPCCDKQFKINRKKFNRTMLQYLEALYEFKNDGWIKASRIRIQAREDSSVGAPSKEIQTGDYKILPVWGLAEIKYNPTLVHINQKGIDFLKGNITIPEAALLENNKNKFVRFDGPQVDVHDVAQTQFRLKDL